MIHKVRSNTEVHFGKPSLPPLSFQQPGRYMYREYKGSHAL